MKTWIISNIVLKFADAIDATVEAVNATLPHNVTYL